MALLSGRRFRRRIIRCHVCHRDALDVDGTDHRRLYLYVAAKAPDWPVDPPPIPEKGQFISGVYFYTTRSLTGHEYARIVGLLEAVGQKMRAQQVQRLVCCSIDCLAECA